MRERPRTERLRPRPVGDRPGHQLGRPAHDLAARQRVARVGGELGLDADDPGRRAERLDRHRDPARQPAATDRDEDDRDVRQVLDELEADRPLAGDDPIVVEGRDDLEPALGGELLGHPLALVAGRADDDDLGAIGRHPFALDRRRVGRHHDDRRRTEQARRSSDALGMVARRVGDDAAPELLRRQRRDRGVGAAQLEGPDRLERLGLQEPSQLGRSERHERGAGRDPAQPVGRRRGSPRCPTSRHGRDPPPSPLAVGDPLAVDAAGGPRQRLEPIDRDRPAAPDAGPERAGIQPREAPRRRARAGGRSDRAARGPAAGRRPGWPQRPAIRRSSGRARRSSPRARRPAARARRAAPHASSSSGVAMPEMVRERYTPWEYPEEAPWRPRSIRSAA